MTSSTVIACDLDGTLAYYDTWKGISHIGEPIPEMVHKVKRALYLGHEVVIFTARASTKDKEELRLVKTHINEWTKRHLGRKFDITATKYGYFTEFWDDKAVGIEKNKGIPSTTSHLWRSL